MKKNNTSSVLCDSCNRTNSESLTAKVSAKRVGNAAAVDNSTASVSLTEVSTTKEEIFQKWVEDNTDYPYMCHMGLSIRMETDMLHILFDPNPDAKDWHDLYGYEVSFSTKPGDDYYNVSASYGIGVLELSLFQSIADNRETILTKLTTNRNCRL